MTEAQNIFSEHAEAIRAQIALSSTYEIFAAAGRAHFGSDLAGKLVASGGMGATGGVQPLAATMNGAAFLGIDAEAEQIKRVVKSGYCDVMVNDLDEALRILKNAVRKREPASVGLVGNCADVIPAMARRGVVPDLLTDCSSTDLRGGYIPRGLNAEQARGLFAANADEYRKQALDSMALQVAAMIAVRELGAIVFDSGNRIAKIAAGADGTAAAEFPDGAAEYLAPLASAGREIFVMAALSGQPRDITRADRLALEMFAENEALCQWIARAQKGPRFPGVPARVMWLTNDERTAFIPALNDLAARGELQGAIATGSANDVPPRAASATLE